MRGLVIDAMMGKASVLLNDNEVFDVKTNKPTCIGEYIDFNPEDLEQLEEDEE